MVMIQFISGFILGALCFYIFVLYKNHRARQKKGAKNDQYKNVPFNARLRDAVRHIIFEYNIKRKNNDFLFNIILNGNTVMQLMHRTHFPELCESESDIDFGLALYIPVNDWSEEMLSKLDKIVDEESEIIRKNKSGSIEYYVVDLGNRVRFGGYFLLRIINEVFQANESEFTSELFSEGNLPYWLN